MINVNFFSKTPQPGESSPYERVQFVLGRNKKKKSIHRKEFASVEPSCRENRKAVGTQAFKSYRRMTCGAGIRGVWGPNAHRPDT